MKYRGVIFDLGGVVLGSPLHAIARYEEELGIPLGFVNRLVVERGAEGAWARLERGELDMEAFFAAFDAECAAAGQNLSARTMMDRIKEESAPRPQMLAALARLRTHGYRLAALTNNWASDREPTHPLRDRFDVFVESSVVGLRKPDPRIYHLTCERLGVTPEEAVFLDDIGTNLKSARQLGMLTIKVNAPEQALQELGEALGMTFPSA